MEVPGVDDLTVPEDSVSQLFAVDSVKSTSTGASRSKTMLTAHSSKKNHVLAGVPAKHQARLNLLVAKNP